MSEELTSEQFSLRYMWPCAEERLRRELITREQFDQLKRLVETNGQPSREFLEVCFPGAVKRQREFAGGDEVLMWRLSKVAEYWHQHRGIEGTHCDVYQAEVVSTFGRFIRLVGGGKLPAAVLNDFNLDLSPGDRIFIHLFVAIEKV